VQPIVRFLAVLCQVGCLRVGRKGLPPIANARENVRGHVLRVRCCLGNLGVAQGRIETFLRERRIVVRVNQVMRYAWVLRAALRDRLQNCRGLELAGVGFIGWE
jgi:hypothetical protein